VLLVGLPSISLRMCIHIFHIHDDDGDIHTKLASCIEPTLNPKLGPGDTYTFGYSYFLFLMLTFSKAFT